MKKHRHHFILLLAILLLPIPRMDAQDTRQGNLYYYCWEETLKPEMYQEYLSTYRELAGICKEINYPFPLIPWQARPMVIQFWVPLNSLDEIESVGSEWNKVVQKFGVEKFQKFQNTILHQYAKTAVVLGDLTYLPADPNLSSGLKPYCRWIEIYLKPGTSMQFEREVQWINEKRSAHQVKQYINFARGGLGFESPDYIVTYYDTSEREFVDYADSLGPEYSKDYQEFLRRIRKLFRKPPEILDLYLQTDLVHFPE